MCCILANEAGRRDARNHIGPKYYSDGRILFELRHDTYLPNILPVPHADSVDYDTACYCCCTGGENGRFETTEGYHGTVQHVLGRRTGEKASPMRRKFSINMRDFCRVCHVFLQKKKHCCDATTSIPTAAKRRQRVYARGN